MEEKEERTKPENYKSVQIWLKELRGRYYNINEIDLRLELLKKFCDFVGKNPDELVREIHYNFSAVDRKHFFTCEFLLVNPEVYTPKTILKKRDFYNEKINEFIEGLEGIPPIRDNYGNILEGFFLYNGVRMFRKPRVWSHPGGASSK
jgi:hypothetical protein